MHDDTSVTFSGTIQGTSRYHTSITLSIDDTCTFQCSCMAFGPRSGCKHIAALARVVDRDYMIDENSLEVFSKNGTPLSRTLSQPPTHSENTPPDNSRRIDPSEYQIDPEILRNFPLELDPNNPDIISFLLDRKPELLIRKNI